MAFCQKCGAQLAGDTKFCGSCGTPVGAAGSAPSGTAAAGAVSGAASAPLASNVAGLLTYVLGFITGIIFLVIEPYKNDKFVRFHAFQSIFLSAVYIILAIAWGILAATLFTVSIGGFWLLAFWVWVLIRLGFFVLWLFLLFKAYNNERFELPVIGPMAAKQAGY